MAGNQSRGLIQASKTKGWDPTKIPARDGQPEVDITKFDVDQGNLAGYPVGRLPGGPVDSWPDGGDGAASITFSETPTFASPDPSKENKARRTTGADPYAGMPPSTR